MSFALSKLVSFLFFSELIAALFLSQWLRSIERDGMDRLTHQEAKIVSLLRDLLFEADPDADTRQPMSALLLTVWADQFDGVNVWASTVPSASRVDDSSYPLFGQDIPRSCGNDQG